MFISMFISMSSWCLFGASNPSLEFPLESEAQEIYSDLSTNADRNYTKVCSLVPEMPDRPENHENVWWKNKSWEIHNFGPHQIVIFSPREQFPRSVTLPRCSKHNFSKHRFVDENLQVWKPQALWQVSSESWSYQTRLGCCDRWGLWGHRCGTSLAENVWKCMNIGNIWCGKLGSTELEN